MEFLKDLMDAIKLGLTERITSPLLGNFVISWGLWNYRLFMTVFGDNSTEQKFRIIDSELYPDTYTYLIAFIVPLVASLFLIYLYPIAARYVYEHRLKVNKDLMERRHRVEDTEPMSMEQARQQRIDMREREQKWKARIAEVDQENADLRRQLESGRAGERTTKVQSGDVAGGDVVVNHHPRNIAGTTKTIAAKLGVQSGKDLVMAAAAQLSFVSGKEIFTRAELLEAMKAAPGYYKRSYLNNLTKYINQVVADQMLIETASDEYAIKDSYKEYLEEKLTL